MRLRVLLTAAAVAAVPAVVAPGPAVAAPLLCLASAKQIYAPASPISAPVGDVLACRTVTLKEVPGNIPMTAYQVRYVSTDLHGKKVPVTGTVAIPRAAWTKGGSRPTVAFHPGTLGSGPQCAFSKQLAGDYQDMYEGDQIASFLKAGYAVAATDGAGYIDGSVHTYMIGANAGNAVLDVVRASRNIPFSPLKADGPVGISGYSEGGAASLWAAQRAATYAPELKIAGAAAGGVPGDLKMTAEQLNGGPFAGFMVDAVLGLTEAYPTLPFKELLNDKGHTAIADAKTLCLFGTLGKFFGARIENYTTAKYTLAQLYTLTDPSGKSWLDALREQELGVDIGGPNSAARWKIGFPTFQYRGVFEEIIPVATQVETRRRYCAAGIPTQFKDNYLGEHLIADGLAKDDVTAWLGDRFAGKPTAGNC
ncbi:lipase family protein [Actinocorallia sp. API 0066]|uniref:lipase family protein n=1 Tax=Actinocorallia sp. API 0066 TaxID=2896846 RepID=UPI001E3C93D8|nr:lipase family protein [Actinocorallia sp. API 0066]MCD0450669.1 lipase family protein [Actinocorallia sp. API 0066]